MGLFLILHLPILQGRKDSGYSSSLGLTPGEFRWRIKLTESYAKNIDKKDAASLGKSVAAKASAYYEKSKKQEDITLKDIEEHTELENNAVIVLEINHKTLEKKIEKYIDLFLANELVRPYGRRYLTAQKQIYEIRNCLNKLKEDFGPKNISTSFKEILYKDGVVTSIDDKYRFYEPLLALERENFLRIDALRGDEIVLTILDGEIVPGIDFSELQEKFRTHELHWYCPICGNRIAEIWEKDRLNSLLKSPRKTCQKKHVNIFEIMGGKIIARSLPITLSEAVIHKRKRLTSEGDGVNS